CKRSKKCGVSGSFYELCEHFNIANEVKNKKSKLKKREYKKPDVELKNISSKIIKKYIKQRDISEETINYCDIKQGKWYKWPEPVPTFEYYQDGELVYVKYRRIKEKSFRAEKGGKAVLWMLDKADTEKPLVITEGEWDTMAVIEAGWKNAVSVPMGSNNMDWVENCWEKLDKFKKIIIWPDRDNAGEKLKKEIVKRLGRWRCYVVNSKKNDANAHLHYKGKHSVINAINNAEPVPIKRVVQFHEIEPLDLTKINSVKSTVPLVNKYLGGYMMGLVTIWTGVNGSGKSTILGQEVAEAIEQGFGCCMVSGELPHWMVKYWLGLQMAGPDHVRVKYDSIKDSESYFVPGEKRRKIGDWLQNKLFIYDSFDSLKTKHILEVFENVYKRYGTRQFIVDNLMVVSYDRDNYNSKYDKQAQFVKLMKEFAKKYGVHVHVVAHPRKPKGVVTKEDIAGLYEITNWADNVVCLHRLTEKNKNYFNADEREAENIYEIFKSRIYGWQEISIKLDFEETCKRFYQYGNKGDLHKKYGWERQE
ncbi:MAG: bifunctional DNA primase/helicase, partial [Halanaerobiales bacterium]